MNPFASIKKTNEENKEKLSEFFSARKVRLGFLILCFFILLILRQNFRHFGVSIGYLYVLVISLAGFWFGVLGGLITAVISFLIFLLEINLYTHALFKDIVIRSMFVRFSVYIISGIVLGYLSELEKKLKEKLEQLAYHDELTGCLNYRWTVKYLEQEIARSQRYNRVFSIALFDIDHFKKLNDTFGHLVGNEVLKTVASLVRSDIRGIDVVGRYGGDEFLIIFPESTAPEAKEILERIKRHIQEATIVESATGAKRNMSCSISVGIASMPANGKTINDLFKFADTMLYCAKQAGRSEVLCDRRKWVRIFGTPQVQLTLLTGTPLQEIAAQEIYNICPGGALILSEKDIAGTECSCRLSFSDLHISSTVRCSIVHTSKQAAGKYIIGIHFYQIPEGIA